MPSGKWMKDPYRDAVPTGETRPIIETGANKENMSSQPPSEISRPKKEGMFPTYGTGGK